MAFSLVCKPYLNFRSFVPKNKFGHSLFLFASFLKTSCDATSASPWRGSEETDDQSARMQDAVNKEEAILSYAHLFHKMEILKSRDPILRDTAPNTYRNTFFLCHVTLACAVRFKIFSRWTDILFLSNVKSWCNDLLFWT